MCTGPLSGDPTPLRYPSPTCGIALETNIPLPPPLFFLWASGGFDNLCAELASRRCGLFGELTQESPVSLGNFGQLGRVKELPGNEAET